MLICVYLQGGVFIRGGGDKIGEVLTDLQENVNKELDTSFKDTTRAKLLQEQVRGLEGIRLYKWNQTIEINSEILMLYMCVYLG